VTDALLTEMLSDVIGPNSFTKVRLARDSATGLLKGYAHVDFADADTAARAVRELDGLQVEGRTIRADVAVRKNNSSGGSGSGSGRGYYGEGSSGDRADRRE
jgi:RNA recognition motif-containing protein